MRVAAWVAVIASSLILLPMRLHGQPPAGSHVPAWDARGVEPAPWQAVTCLDVGVDGTIVVGTAAPPGDPNVVALDAAGKLIGQSAAGQRWIGEIATFGGGRSVALCTSPFGRAGDEPTLFSVGDSNPQEIPGSTNRDDLFHYGLHSNHTGTHVARYDGGLVGLYGNQLLWLQAGNATPAATRHFPRPPHAITVSLAVHRSGRAIVGCAALPLTEKRAAGPRASEQNLFVVEAGASQPRWSRPLVSNVGRCQPPEKGLYGTPTLPDGTRAELPQQDVPVYAPLSIAVDGEPEFSRVATADYQGWRRWIRSSATSKEENYSTRFVPASPTISVYDAEGKLLHRFGAADGIKQPGWVDLAFLPGARQLLAWPHAWTCRGLAGQAILPADDEARTLWLLDIDTGEVHPLQFPDAICRLAVNGSGTIAATCWNGRLYFLTADTIRSGKLPAGSDVGGPALVAAAPGSPQFVVGTRAGAVQVFAPEKDRSPEKPLVDVALESAVQRKPKPWVANAALTKLADGLWQLPGGRVESDLGRQYLIEAPDGLLLIEGHAGLSFEREWAAIASAGFDPKHVKYVMATHEHGDHAPGSYLWRVATGAQFICSPQMAYMLQHHIPAGTGYGLHPPVPTDIAIDSDTALDLAGFRLQALRLPGHTFGAMGWLLEREGKRFVSIGDLIMPDGVLGYSGSVNFSATDVLASLRKLDALKVDTILPGHGPVVGPERYVTAGIGVGRHVGWGKIRPEDPDPRYRLTQANVQVVAWNQGITSADVGDFNADRLPDIAVVRPGSEAVTIRVYLNRGGRFGDEPDWEIAVPGVGEPTKLRVRPLNDDGVPDFLVGGPTSAIVLSDGVQPRPTIPPSPVAGLGVTGRRAIDPPSYRVLSLPLAEANQALSISPDGSSQRATLVDAKFGTFARLVESSAGRAMLQPWEPALGGPYADVRALDVNGDGREDLVSSYGQVLLRGPDGKLPAEPSLQLPPASAKDWSLLGLGDFNADGRPDITLWAYGQGPILAHVFYNTGDAQRPYPDAPSTRLDFEPVGSPKQSKGSLVRDSLAVADWNGDGVDDLFAAKGQQQQIRILYGNREGLRLDHGTTLELDYRLHYETGLFPADFNGDGRMDVAALGNTNTGVGTGGPLAVYVYLQAGGGE